jgi:hypothetical protein
MKSLLALRQMLIWSVYFTFESIHHHLRDRQISLQQLCRHQPIMLRRIAMVNNLSLFLPLAVHCLLVYIVFITNYSRVHALPPQASNHQSAFN